MAKFLNSALLAFLLLPFAGLLGQETSSKHINIGVVLCGAEFGEQQLPGKLNKDYTYPTKDEIQYYAAKGFNPIVLPFKWERVQRKLGEELDSLELSRMKSFVEACGEYKISVILTLQNFAVYMADGKEIDLGSKHLSNEVYKDFWMKMASAFTTYNNIYGFDIMNEPRGIFGRKWRRAAQSAIDGIRAVDLNTYIIVDGENSSFSFDWSRENSKLRKLKDPSDKIVYDAHCYFDYNHSGRYDGKYEGNVKADVGITRVKPFIKWLKRYNKMGIIGEFGVPTDKHWLGAMDKFVAYLQENGLGGNYWAGGPWWNDYTLSIEPQNGVDKPQMKVLDKYLPPTGDKK